MSDAGYKYEPIEPEDERAKLMREFVQAQDYFANWQKRWDALNK
jgi:hypothetical protein